MISIILVSHGPLAKALLESAQMVAGRQKQVYALGLEPLETAEHFKARVQAQLERCLIRGGVVLVSDLLLGTPFNVSAELMQTHQFRHLTAMSLPLLLNLLSARESKTDLAALCRGALEKASAQMMDVNDFVGGLSQ
ncbi:hypothetical protein WMO64_06330 [Pseudoflavonifractor sp. CLA-AP-H29]|uniref:PTS EIIA type-4 domain-containing protein n=1 Tax=Pseudoflavonifractor intestinihominis TaxID=3133171 RepID=A0ABV1E6Z8_9FIRM